MYFLVKTATHLDTLMVEESFFFRPAPGYQWFCSCWQALFHQRRNPWKYINIPREEVPTPASKLTLNVEGDYVVIGERAYLIETITLRHIMQWCFESVLYWTFDESVTQSNWRRWEKTGGKGF